MQRTCESCMVNHINKIEFFNEGLLNCTFYDGYLPKIQRRLACLVTNPSITGLENNETNKINDEL